MYTCYEVILVGEDGEYPQETFQTEQSAIEWMSNNEDRYGQGQYLYVKSITRTF